MTKTLRNHVIASGFVGKNLKSMEDSMPKKYFFILTLIALAILAGACTAAQAAPSPQNETNSGQDRTITVNGTGTVTLTPDIARISIGVQTKNIDAAAAVGENNDMSQSIMAALSNLGISDDDIRTSDFSIWPQQEYDNNGNLTGTSYMVQNTVNVTVRNLDQLGNLLDAAVQAGANNIYGITFDVADRTAAEAKALVSAVENANAQAEVLAGAANISVGEVISMNSYASPPPTPYYGFGVGGGAAAESAAPISPGQLDITTNVTVVYQILPQ
jgi:uncharacterized protein